MLCLILEKLQCLAKKECQDNVNEEGRHVRNYCE